MKLEDEQLLFIKDAFQQMKSKQDFLALLNYTKPIIYGDKAVPFEIKHLRFHSNPKANRRRYVRFSIPKKAGGTRTIHAPNKGLKSVLKCLNLVLQCTYEPHKAATGFVANKSIVDNAKQHTGSLYVYNIDLKDFFPSVDQARLWGRLQHPPFNLNKKSDRLDLANIIGGLCFEEMEVERMDEKGEWTKVVKNVLPQGAPTSPTITNIICERLDFYLTAVAKRFGLKYSRYADDITFSSMHNVYQKDGDFIKELHRIIAAQGFHIKESKVRLQRPGYRQEVTGLIVNEKVNVSKRFIKRLRLWLYLWEHYGYIKAEQIFTRDYVGDRGHLLKGKPNMAHVIWGKLEYLKMVKGKKDGVYVGLSIRFEKLTERKIESVKIAVPPKGLVANIPNIKTDITDSEKAGWITPEEYKEVLMMVKGTDLVKIGYQKSFEQVYNLTNGYYRYFTTSGELVAGMKIEISDQKFKIDNFELGDTEGIPESVKTAQNFEDRLNSQVLCFNAGLVRNKAIIEITILENFGNAFGGKFTQVEENFDIKDSNVRVVITAKERKKKGTLNRDITIRKGTEVPYENEVENLPEVIVNKQHNPLGTLTVLKLFQSSESLLKYSTHSWEFGIGEDEGHYSGFIEFSNKLTAEWNTIKRKYRVWIDNKWQYKIPKSLWKKIDLFISSPDFMFIWKAGVARKSQGWGKNFVRFGWSSLELRKWATENPKENPLNYPLPIEKQLEVNGKILYSFKDVTVLFKSEIEFREDTSQFYNLILHLWDKVWHFAIQLDTADLEKLKGLSFFTDTQKIEEGLKRIFESFIQGGRSTFDKAIIQRSDIAIDTKNNQPYIEVRITQVGSFSQRMVNDPKLDGRSGDCFYLKVCFVHLCDWSVESKFGDGKTYRLNYLTANNDPFFQEIQDSSIKGFTHILKFYL